MSKRDGARSPTAGVTDSETRSIVSGLCHLNSDTHGNGGKTYPTAVTLRSVLLRPDSEKIGVRMTDLNGHPFDSEFLLSDRV